jgi:uncharacterized phiE125 gp8 family phage protein
MTPLESKRADEVRDYSHDWSAWLAGDTIVTSTWVVNGVTKDDDSNTESAVTVLVSGGTNGVAAELSNTIVTAAGRTETEVFVLPINNLEEPIALSEMKDYLRVLDSVEDRKIMGMISRARRWVEQHTGHALVRRSIIEYHTPNLGRIQVYLSPVVSLTGIAYNDSDGVEQAYVGRSFPPGRILMPALTESWPTLNQDEKFRVTYVAGPATSADVDPRHIGAILALVEGEYSQGYAYPEEAVAAAERCCRNARSVVV